MDLFAQCGQLARLFLPLGFVCRIAGKAGHQGGEVSVNGLDAGQHTKRRRGLATATATCEQRWREHDRGRDQATDGAQGKQEDHSLGRLPEPAPMSRAFEHGGGWFGCHRQARSGWDGGALRPRASRGSRVSGDLSRVDPEGGAKRSRECPTGREPVRGRLRQATGKSVIEIGWKGADSARRGGDLVVEMRGQGRGRRFTRKRRIAGKALEGDACQGVDVHAPVDRPPLYLLRCDVVGGADDLAGVGQVAAGPGDPGETEVGQVHVLSAPRRVGYQDVCRLDVTVDEVADVGGVEGGGDLRDDARRSGWRQGRLAGQHRLEVGSLDEAHREVELAPILSRLEDGQHVGMVDSGGGTGLRLEPGAKVGVPGQRRGDQLDRHVAPKVGVAGAVHDAHSSVSDDLAKQKAAYLAPFGPIGSRTHGTAPFAEAATSSKLGPAAGAERLPSDLHAEHRMHNQRGRAVSLVLRPHACRFLNRIAAMRPGEERQQEITPPMPATGSELKMVMDRERAGGSFALLRNGAGELCCVELEAGDNQLSVGRDAFNAIPLTWDREVSRLHARLSPVGGEWVVEDDGLSRNGTFLNGRRLAGSARLRDGDVLRFGGVTVSFRSTTPGSRSETMTSAETEPPTISAAEARVLQALARPWAEGQGMAAPASNGEIAAELVISVHTVKSHLRVLFEKFQLTGLPQSRKRAALVEAAFRAGVVGKR